MGFSQGFYPAHDERAAPIQLIQQAYRDVYKLPYEPIILHHSHFNLYDPKAHDVYYSLNFPGSVSFSPKAQSKSSLITDLQNLRIMHDHYLRGLKGLDLQLEPTIFADMLKNVTLEYFHPHGKAGTPFKPIHQLPHIEPAFKSLDHNFPDNAPFFKACVRISTKA